MTCDECKRLKQELEAAHKARDFWMTQAREAWEIAKERREIISGLARENVRISEAAE